MLPAQKGPGPLPQRLAGPLRPAPHQADGDPEHPQQNDRQQRQGQNPVEQQPVQTLGQGLAPLPPGQTAPGQRARKGIPAGGNDLLPVVLQVPLTGGNHHLQPLAQRQSHPQGLVHRLVPLKELDQVPGPSRGGQVIRCQNLHILQCPAGAGRKQRRRFDRFPTPGRRCRRLGGLRHAGAPGSGENHHRAPQPPGQQVPVQFLAPPLQQVRPVYRHHHGNPQLQQLGGEVEVALQVGPVHQVQQGIGALFHQKPPGHHLLRGVGREGVHPRQVHKPDGRVLPPASLPPLHRHPGPVAHKLVVPGEGVKKGGLAGVGVAGQGNGHHIQSLPSSRRSCRPGSTVT